MLVSIANELSSRGHKITIVSTSNDISDTSGFSRQIVIRHKDEPERKLIRNLPYFKHLCDSGVWSLNQKPERLYDYFIGNKEFDVEIAFFPGRPTKALLGSKNKHSKKILWVHTDYKKTQSYKACFSDMSEVITANGFYDKVICCSESALKSYKEIIGRSRDVFAVPNIVDDEFIKKAAQQPCEVAHRRFTFICVSRLSEEKGIMRLLKATKHLLDSGCSFDVWIVGDGNQRSEIEAYIADNALNNVLLLGLQQNPYPYMKSADCYICPSYFEGFGLSLYEAAALGKVIISTDVCGAKELIGDNKFGIVCENSDSGITQMMSEILRPDIFEHYLNNMASYRNKLGKKETVDKLETLFFGDDFNG